MLVKSTVKSIGFSPVRPSCEFVWSDILIFWSWKISLEDLNLVTISFNTEFEKTEIPSCSDPKSSSQTVYNVL